MEKEEYNKYKLTVDLYYSEKRKFSVPCIYCKNCDSYKEERYFPNYGQKSEYRISGSLCTRCYTEKYKHTQEFFEEVIDSFLCVVCDKVKEHERSRPYERRPMNTCVDCHNESKQQKKSNGYAKGLLKQQGITNINEDLIKTKKLTLEIKRSIRESKKQTNDRNLKEIIKELREP